MAKTKTDNSNIVNELLAERDKLRPTMEAIEKLLNHYGYDADGTPQPDVASNGRSPTGPRLQTVLVKIYKAAGKPLTPEEAHAEAVKTNPQWTLQDVKSKLNFNCREGFNGKPPLFKEIQDGCYVSAQAQTVPAPAA